MSEENSPKLINGIFAIKDSKAEYFLPPFFMRTNGEAVRAFDDAVNKSGTPLYDHPEDFFLYKIGEFDVYSGLVTSCEHASLGCALDFKKVK